MRYVQHDYFSFYHGNEMHRCFLAVAPIHKLQLQLSERY